MTKTEIQAESEKAEVRWFSGQVSFLSRGCAHE
jgi:hypothetical protein